MKKVILEIDCEIAHLSKIIIDGKEIRNVIGLDIHATVAEPIPKVIFELHGSELVTEPFKQTDFFIKPCCPKCGFGGEPVQIENSIGEDSPNSDDSQSTGISEGISLSSDSPK